MELRLLRSDETSAAARQHRAAGVLIPGFDPTLHTLEETCAFYREVFVRGPVWGAFENGVLLGHIALEPGWIEHLFVEPARHGEGIGRSLLSVAQQEQDELRLWTFQRNARARRFYEAAGFVAEEFTDGAGNEEKEPDVRYHWRRG